MGKNPIPAFLFILAAIILATAMPLKADVRYYVVDLGTLGGDFSDAYAINEKCQIVGSSEFEKDDWSRHAAIFDPRGTSYNIDLRTLGGTDSASHSINNAGAIVGLAADESDNWLATLFDANGTGVNINLGSLPDDSGSWALSINNTGHIVGYTQDLWHAARFVLGGDNIDLGTLGGIYSAAYAINDSNQIVGAAEDEIYHWHAAIFDPNGDEEKNIDLGTLPGGTSSHAFANNDAGQIVGDAGDLLGKMTATLFVIDDNNIDLGTLGGTESSALSINNDGQIVGWADDADGNECAALFDSTGNKNNIDLNTQIASDANWKLFEARAINDRGWIVGSGRNPDGLYREFLLIPISDNLGQFAQHWLESDCEDTAWCEGNDLNFSGRVNFADYAILLQLWSGSQPHKEIPPCDYDRDGAVGLYDLAQFLERWLDSDCAADKNCDGKDFDRSGGVNFADFAVCGREFTGL